MKTTKITPAQAAARRANGKLSQGPKTAAGKAVVSQNALKFGFFALSPLLPGESAEAFAEFRQQLYASYQPVGGAEVMLVDRIVESGWRLRRFPAIEAATYSAELLEEQAALARRKAKALLQHRVALRPSDAAEPAECEALLAQETAIREELNDPQYALGRVFRRDVKAGGALIRLSRCEALLERGFYRCLRELREMQQVRKAAEAKPAPSAQQKRQNKPTESDIPWTADRLADTYAPLPPDYFDDPTAGVDRRPPQS